MLEERQCPLLVARGEGALEVGEKDRARRHLDIPLGQLVKVGFCDKMAAGDILLRDAVLRDHGRRDKAEVVRLTERTILLAIVERCSAEGFIEIARRYIQLGRFEQRNGIRVSELL